MKHLQIKNVPDDLHAAVRRRAAEEGMTMSDYLMELARQDLALPSRREWLEMLARREPVEGVKTVAALDEERRERDAELEAANRH